MKEAFWKQVSLGDWQKKSGRPVNKTRPISCVMEENSNKSGNTGEL